jgi:hypothetical protein
MTFPWNCRVELTSSAVWSKCVYRPRDLIKLGPADVSRIWKSSDRGMTSLIHPIRKGCWQNDVLELLPSVPNLHSFIRFVLVICS